MTFTTTPAAPARANLEAAFGGVLRHFTLGGEALHDDADARRITGEATLRAAPGIALRGLDFAAPRAELEHPVVRADPRGPDERRELCRGGEKVLFHNGVLRAGSDRAGDRDLNAANKGAGVRFW